ncbi:MULTISPECIES: thermonuclease family protein [unclassified Roseivivax]|uniref:thermonuclease family protein n=1 Tax=unclassified Roseivivax TaxID=2639302 RepID=UPI00126969BE|nr:MULTISPECIES: hypothetical protein [unclassified Roseivivax]
MARIIDLKHARRRRYFRRNQRRRRGLLRGLGRAMSPVFALALILMGWAVWEEIRAGGDLRDVATVVVNRGLPQSTQGGTLSGHVTHVRDGDTIEVAGTPVRFRYLNCAELGTRAGEEAKRVMRDLAAGAEVTCSLIGRMSYDRRIGTCRLKDGPDLRHAMYARGQCGG